MMSQDINKKPKYMVYYKSPTFCDVNFTESTPFLATMGQSLSEKQVNGVTKKYKLNKADFSKYCSQRVSKAEVLKL